MEKTKIKKSPSTSPLLKQQAVQQQHQESKIMNCDNLITKHHHNQNPVHHHHNSDKNISTKTRDEEKIKNLKDAIPDIDNIFDIHNRIGSGTFSTVFLASLKGGNDDNIYSNSDDKEKRKLFAIKHIIPTSSPQRIVKELKCLVDIGGVDNIIGIRLCLRRNENVAFVMPYIEHEKFQTYFEKMKLSEVQLYMKNLLIALRRVHKFNIIHRDVKPSNFLYDRVTKQFLLIDFGLAQTVMSRAEREASLLKRKTDDRNQIGDAVGNVSGMSSNNPKKICLEKLDDDQSKSPEKMPLKQLNGANLAGTYAGIAACSVEQSNNKNSKSESPNNINTHIEKGAIDSNTPKTNKRNSMYQKVIVNDPQQHQQGNLASNVNASNVQRDQTKCNCYGKSQICKICLVKKEIPASRAGTPGYRPPEVLLKYTDQTTAVDVWAAGVIFISILSGVYPFFKAPDDFIALAEIVMLFGDDCIRKTAFSLGRQVTMSRKCKPLNLRRLCVRLRNRNKINRSDLSNKYEKTGKLIEECSNCQQMSYDCLCQNTKYDLEDVGPDIFPDSAYDFLIKLLEVNPHKRITATKALQHPFLREKFD